MGSCWCGWSWPAGVLTTCFGLTSTLKVFKACTGQWVLALVSLRLFYLHLAWIDAICQGERVNLKYLRASQKRRHCPNAQSEPGVPQGVQETQTGAKRSEKESASLEQCEVEDSRTHGTEWGTINWFLKPLPSEMYSVRIEESKVAGSEVQDIILPPCPMDSSMV